MCWLTLNYQLLAYAEISRNITAYTLSNLNRFRLKTSSVFLFKWNQHTDDGFLTETDLN